MSFALQCKLFDSLVKPILSYSSKFWAVDPKAGASAEKLHRQFLKQSLRVRNSTTNEMVLTDFGKYSLQTHFWKQVVCFHNRAVKMPNSCLVKLAMVDGVQLQNNRVVNLQKSAGNRVSQLFLLHSQGTHVFLRFWMWQILCIIRNKQCILPYITMISLAV